LDSEAWAADDVAGFARRSAHLSRRHMCMHAHLPCIQQWLIWVVALPVTYSHATWHADLFARRCVMAWLLKKGFEQTHSSRLSAGMMARSLPHTLSPRPQEWRTGCRQIRALRQLRCKPHMQSTPVHGPGQGNARLLGARSLSGRAASQAGVPALIWAVSVDRARWLGQATPRSGLASLVKERPRRPPLPPPTYHPPA
jgi:hypothetical protein